MHINTYLGVHISGRCREDDAKCGLSGFWIDYVEFLAYISVIHAVAGLGNESNEVEHLQLVRCVSARRFRRDLNLVMHVYISSHPLDYVWSPTLFSRKNYVDPYFSIADMTTVTRYNDSK